MGLQMKPIAYMHSDFPEKFGIPRQSGLVPELTGQIVFEPEYRDVNALKGLEEYSHIWLIWVFSGFVRAEISEGADADGDAKDGGRADCGSPAGWSPTVRPPRLGGDMRMGVFATRSPNRPNPIGLSCVRLLEIREIPGNGHVLIVSGADLMDGTPILDIKPYLPYTDSHPHASGGFSARIGNDCLQVTFPEHLLERLPKEKQAAAIHVLRCDPRPRYQSDPKRIYGMAFGGYNIRFRVEDNILTVSGVDPDDDAGKAAPTGCGDRGMRAAVPAAGDDRGRGTAVPAADEDRREHGVPAADEDRSTGGIVQ